MARTVWGIAAYMQLAVLINQIAVHRSAANRATALHPQQAGLALTFHIVIRADDFVTRHQVDRRLTALLRRQLITRAAKENAGTGDPDLHRSGAGWAFDIRIGGRITAHSAVFGISSSAIKLLLKATIKAIENSFPIDATLGDIVQLLFKARSKVVVHQVGEGLLQAIGYDVTHLLRVKTTILETHITAILNSGDNRGISGRASNTPLFKLLHQTRFRVARRRLGKVLGRINFCQIKLFAYLDVWQCNVFVFSGGLRRRFKETFKLDYAATDPQLVIRRSNCD